MCLGITCALLISARCSLHSDATKQIQAFATQTVGSRMANSLQEYLV